MMIDNHRSGLRQLYTKRAMSSGQAKLDTQLDQRQQQNMQILGLESRRALNAGQEAWLHDIGTILSLIRTAATRLAFPISTGPTMSPLRRRRGELSEATEAYPASLHQIQGKLPWTLGTKTGSRRPEYLHRCVLEGTYH